MSDKDAAKRRRQARNRQERMSRQKRTEGVRKAEAGRKAEATRPTRPAGGSKTASPGRDGRPSRSANPAPAGGGFLGKLFPPRPEAPAKAEGAAAARPARAPQPRESVVFTVDTGDATGLRAEMVRRMAQPGGRAATVSLVLALVAVVMLFAVPLVPRAAFPAGDVGTAAEPGDGGFAEMVVRARPGTEAERTERLEALEGSGTIDAGTQRLTDVLSPFVVAGFSLALLLIVGTAFRSLDKPTRSRTLLISALALVAVMFVLGQILLPLVAALGFASYQSRKADRLAAVQAAEG